jgi:hypothetical protein
VSADRAWDRADERSHAEAFVADPVRHGQIAHPAGASGCRERADETPVDRVPKARHGEESGERPNPVVERHEQQIHDDKEQKHHREHRPGDVLEHPLDGAAER